MNRGPLDAYLDELSRQLRAHGVFEPRILEEIHGHLLDAVEQAHSHGQDLEEAQRQALARFGPAKALAAEFAAERSRTMYKILFGVALGLGVLIAYVDSRPTWDDSGISAMAVLLSCGLLGTLGPKRPWLWALSVGLWIPLVGIVSTHNYGSLLALIFAFAGAYIGMAFRKLLALA